MRAAPGCWRSWRGGIDGGRFAAVVDPDDRLDFLGEVIRRGLVRRRVEQDAGDGGIDVCGVNHGDSRGGATLDVESAAEAHHEHAGPFEAAVVVLDGDEGGGEGDRHQVHPFVGGDPERIVLAGHSCLQLASSCLRTSQLRYTNNKTTVKNESGAGVSERKPLSLAGFVLTFCRAWEATPEASCFTTLFVSVHKTDDSEEPNSKINIDVDSE
jgi:hypothetical protein